MSYRMFIDDERMPPNDGKEWVICRSSAEAKLSVLINGFPSFISFDHDLGGEDTSMNFIHWFITEYQDGNLNIPEFGFDVHSQNPIGAENITSLVQNFIDYVLEE